MRYRDTTRKFSLVKNGLAMLSIIFIGFLITRFLNSSIFEVKTVYLDASREDLPDLSIFQEKQNWLFFEEKKITDNILKKYPDIKSVSVKKIFPNTILVKVEPRAPVAKLAIEGQTIFYDQEGKTVLLKSGINPDNFPWIDCPDAKNLPGLKFITKLLRNNIKIDQLTCKDENTYALYITGTDFILSSSAETDKSLASLQFLIKQFRIDGRQPKSVDLRFDKPVLKFDEAATASPSGD